MLDVLELTNILSNYPFLEKVVLLGITLIFAAMQVKKRFKDISDGMSNLSSSMNDLNKSLQEHIVQTDLRMSEGEERFKNISIDIEKLKVHVGLK